MDIVEHNRTAWDEQSSSGESEWSQPVGPDVIAAARDGKFGVILTPNRIVPQAWFGDLEGRDVLGLASGGGQQVPVLAAAGANVTSFDNSPEQLARDREVADRDGLNIAFEQGDMMDLSRFDAESFDLIFNPVSTVFVPDVEKVWHECARVLRPGGRLMTGCMNPDFYLFDHEAIEAGGPLQVRFSLPFSDPQHLSPDELKSRMDRNLALEFGHSLDAYLGGLLRSGLLIHDFYEDDWSDEATPLNAYMKVSFAVLARKPG